MLARVSSSRHLLDGLVRAELATAANERVGRGRQIEATRIKITDAGRTVLRSAPSPHKTFGTTASPPRIKQANGKAGVEAERRDLARLSQLKQKSLEYQGGTPKSFHYRAGAAA